jgi:hypothetical protein
LIDRADAIEQQKKLRKSRVDALEAKTRTNPLWKAARARVVSQFGPAEPDAGGTDFNRTGTQAGF